MRQRSLLLVAAVSIGLGACAKSVPDEAPRGPERPGSGRIVNLYDAFGVEGKGLEHDFGFSAFIEYRGVRILFDSGTDAEILKKNAATLGIDLASVDFAIASHSHPQTARATGQDISLVMGGYHLIPYKADTLQGVASRLKNELGVRRVAPAHCTGHLAQKTLMDAYGDDFVRAGLGSVTRF